MHGGSTHSSGNSGSKCRWKADMAGIDDLRSTGRTLSMAEAA